MTFLLALALAATPGPLKVASTPFTAVGGLATDLAEFYGEAFATQLGEQPGFQVTTPKALGAMLGMERQKQMLGCAEASSCLTELASALGVDALVLGEAAKLDQSTQVNVRVIRARDGATLFSLSRRARTSEAVLDELGRAATEAAVQLRERFGRPPVGAAPQARVRWAPWAVVGGGAIAAGVGTYFLVQSNAAWTQLNSPPVVGLSPARAVNEVAAGGKRDLTLGSVLAGAGAAAIAAGVTWAVLGAETPTPTAWLGPEGAGVGIVGRLP